MPVSGCWRESEPVDLMLITVVHEATQGVLPPLGGGFWWCPSYSKITEVRETSAHFKIFGLTSLLIECMCATPLSPAVIVMRGRGQGGLVFHPLQSKFTIITSPQIICLTYVVTKWSTSRKQEHNSTSFADTFEYNEHVGLHTITIYSSWYNKKTNYKKACTNVKLKS